MNLWCNLHNMERNEETADCPMCAWEARMAKKREAETKRQAEEAEKARQAYLHRTGRREMKP